MATSIGVGRPAESKNRIVEEFRSRIVAGELHPGSRFPTRSEIEQQYGAGTATVQRALETLREDGFIRVYGRRGTFVADNPPHLSRYAVVFPHPASHGGFWGALSKELEIISRQRPDCQLVPYYDVNAYEESEQFFELRQEVIDHRIAGLIFTSYPYLVENTPLLDEPSIPRVAIMTPYELSIPTVGPDGTSFLTRALNKLKNQGYRRIAFLKSTSDLLTQELLDSLVAERELETRPYWCLDVDVVAPSAARNCIHLLMYCSELPEALVICDDNLVESATQGLLDAKHKVPRNFGVIAHSNFPYPTPCLYPAMRLGFDVRQILQLCVENINAQRRGEPVSTATILPACFEEEIELPTAR